jgi:hypothetical protein
MGDIINGPATGTFSGETISLSGDGRRLLIGTHRANSNTGDARVYQYTGTNANGSWAIIGAPLLGSTLGERFGLSCSMSEDGNTIAVGVDRWTTNIGKVSMFRYDGTSYVGLGAPIEGLSTGENFGRVVSLSSDGNRVVSSSIYWSASRGQARVYEYSEGQWMQLGQFIDGLASSNQDGNLVSMSRDATTIVMSAPYSNGVSGHARMFGFNSSDTTGSLNGTWQQLGNTLVGASGEQLGSSTSISADGSVVALGSTSWNSYAGRITLYSYALTTDTWEALGTQINKKGTSISLSNNGMILGNGASPANSYAGEASVYFYNGE